LRIVAVMYFRTPLATPRAQGGAGAWWAAAVCALLVVGIGVYPGPLISESNQAAPVGAAGDTPPPQSAPRPGVAASRTMATEEHREGIEDAPISVPP